MTPILIAQLVSAAASGLIVGSFLTVLSARIPAALRTAAPGTAVATILGAVSWPGSHCQACHTPVAWRDNIPLLSYVCLGGKCRACGQSYGLRYAALEAAAAAAAMLCLVLFGWGLQAVLSFVLLASLLALSVIDLREQLLPDVLVAPLVPLGLYFHAHFRDGLIPSLLGMSGAYLAMWTIGQFYRFSTGRDGMGFGDVKLAAAAGAWLGVDAVPFFLTASFASGVLVMLPLTFFAKVGAKTPVPFGPFLAFNAALLVLVPAIWQWTASALFGS